MKKYTAKDLLYLIKKNSETKILFKKTEQENKAENLLDEDDFCLLAGVPQTKTNNFFVNNYIGYIYINTCLQHNWDGIFATESMQALQNQMTKIVEMVNDVCEKLHHFHKNNHDIISDEFIEKFNS